MIPRLPTWLLLSSVALTFSVSATPPANDTIEQAMGEVMQATKALGKGIDEGSRDAALAELAKIQGALLAAKGETPDTAAAVADSERAAFVAEYRTTLLEALKLACDAEIAVVNGKYADAQAIVKTKLGALKAAGHDKFKGD